MNIEVTRVDVEGRSLPVMLDTAAGRLELDVAGEVAVIEFRLHDKQLAAVHTEVPAALRGKGIGDKLARALLDYVRREGLMIQPYCPFVAAFIKRHGEYADLVAPLG